MAGSAEVVFGFFWREGFEDCPDRPSEVFDGSLGGFLQERLELGEMVGRAGFEPAPALL